MISMKELLGRVTIAEVPHAAQVNLEDLQRRVNIVRAAWGKPLTVTSGFRDMQHHIDVYRTKALREKRKFSMLQVPMGSKHLSGQAVDFADPDGALYKWLHEHPEIMEQAGLYGEAETKGWVHLQSAPFGSYKPGGLRWFKVRA